MQQTNQEYFYYIFYSYQMFFCFFLGGGVCFIFLTTLVPLKGNQKHKYQDLYACRLSSWEPIVLISVEWTFDDV